MILLHVIYYKVFQIFQTKKFKSSKKLNVNILGYIENNIFNADKKPVNFFEINKINKLASYSFHDRIWNFDPEFNCEESNDVAKKIYEMT